ncbi:MAG: hypothetical protein AAB481_02640 [Patescibacteria group bacterium]
MALETIRPAREPLPADASIPSAQEIETSDDAFIQAMDAKYRDANIPYWSAIATKIAYGDIAGLEEARRVYNKATIIDTPLCERLDSIGRRDTYLARQARSLARFLSSRPDNGKNALESSTNADPLTQWRIIRSQLSYQNKHGTESLIQELRVNPDPQRRRAIYEALHGSDRELATIVRQFIDGHRERLESPDEHIIYFIHKQCEELTIESLQSLVTESARQLLPFFAALDHTLGQDSEKNNVEAWDESYSIHTIHDRTGRRDMKFRPIQDAVSLALEQLGHKDLYDQLSVIVPKEPHDVARCVPIRPPGEVMVIVYEPREDDDTNISEYFHEIGHGIHFAGMKSDIAYIDIVTGKTWMEAMAFLYEDLLLEPGVLIDEASSGTSARLRALHMVRRLNSIRAVLLHLTLELSLYESDAKSLSLEDLAAKTQEITHKFKPNVQNTHPLWWANDMYIVEYPFYGINDLYGWMIAAQIRAWWKRTHTEPILSKAFGDFLRTTCYPPGNSIPWQEQLREITGEDINPAYLVEELSKAIDLFDEIV